VQIALGDLADPPSFRNAMRGVDTVVHLASSLRDQPRGSIEELVGIATWRMVQAAERTGAERFVFLSALGASTHSRSRFLRAKALAEQAVREACVRTTVLAPSLVYAPGDRWLTLVERLALGPVVPVAGRGRAAFQPMWAEDVAECVVGALRAPAPTPVGGALPAEAPGGTVSASARTLAGAAGAPAAGAAPERYELAGPQTLTHEEVVRTVLRALHRRRLLVRVPAPVARRALRLAEAAAGARAPATWDEAELLEVSMTSARGTADAERLGVTPQAMGAVLDPAHS
jgi:uncharacterized protein YbjT (DUF2867 family)